MLKSAAEKRRTVRDLRPLAAALALVVVIAGVLAIVQPSLHDRTPFESRVRTATPQGDVRGQSITLAGRTPLPGIVTAGDRVADREGPSGAPAGEAASVAQGSSDDDRQTGLPPESLSSEAPEPDAPTVLVPTRDVAPSTNATSNPTPPPPSANQPTVAPTLPPQQPSAAPSSSPTAPASASDPEPTPEQPELTPAPTASLLEDVFDLLPLDD